MTSLRDVPFWFLRHGETDWNARGLSQGNVEVPLNEVGRAQARAASVALGGRGIARIVCSPLGRARETAAIVAEALGLEVAIEDGLREVRFGVQEGHPMAQWFDDWVEGRFTPEGAESFASLRLRGVAALDRTLAGLAPVLVIGHGALFRAVRAEMGLPANVRTPNATPIFCRPGPAGSAWELIPAS